MSSRTARAAALLEAPGLRALVRRADWSGVLVLNYHRIGSGAGTPWAHDLWNAEAEAFDAQLALLQASVDVIGPGDLVAAAASGRGRHVVITFDDGYRDNHAVAFPLLHARGLTATFFLATGFLDRPHVAWWDEVAWMVANATRPTVPAGGWLPADVRLADGERAAATDLLAARFKELPGDRTEAYLEHLADGTGAGRADPALAADTWMTWDMARELRDAGMTLGGHTVSHPVLARLPRSAQEAEVTGCARRLREELGAPMRFFAYPNGDRSSFDAATRDALAAAGVELAFSFYGRHSAGGRLDPYDVPRTHVHDDLALLRAKLRLPAVFARRG